MISNEDISIRLGCLQAMVHSKVPLGSARLMIDEDPYHLSAMLLDELYEHSQKHRN